MVEENLIKSVVENIDSTIDSWRDQQQRAILYLCGGSVMALFLSIMLACILSGPQIDGLSGPLCAITALFIVCFLMLFMWGIKQFEEAVYHLLILIDLRNKMEK